MPPRKARSSVAQPTKKVSSKKSRKRQLDAFAIAGKVAPEKTKIRSHRLGQVEDDQPRKRRRGDDDDEEEEDGEEDQRQGKRQRNQDDDDLEYGSDSEGNEWTVGAVNDDDDESLDSDEAFGESDEERFEGFTFRGSSTNKPKAKAMARRQKQAQEEEELDLDEGSAEDMSEEDDFGDEGVDLATMLDDDGSDAGEDESDEEDDEQSSEDEEDASSDDEQRHARLQDFVEGLDQSTKTKPATQAEVEDALTLDDLLEDADLDSKTLATLKPKKKQAAELVTSVLPKRQQDAIDRKLATQKAKEQLDRWRDTVIQNRRADFLSFPLRRSDEGDLPNKDTFAPTQQGRPATELEASIRQIMEESGMLTKSVGGNVVEEGESGLLKAEELAMNKLPVEEVLERRAELRRMRELLFREEIKAKRIAKIKSKAYRRVHRKERERLADKERMLMHPEGFANGDLNEDEQEEADRRRAEARMSAKHKDSKWARSLRATDRATWDDDARAGVIEQARRQEELKRRVAGRDIDMASDASDDDDNDNDDDTTTQLRRLANTGNKDEPKGLAALKFMQKAENRRKAENTAAIADLQRELDPEAVDDNSGIEDNGLGRAIFGPKPSTAKPAKPSKRPELEEGSASEDEGEGDAPPADKPTKSQQTTKNVKQATKSSGPLAALRAKTVEEPASTSAWLTAPREGKKSKLDRKLARSNDNEAIIDTRIDANGDSALKTAASEKNAGNTDGWTTVTYKQGSDAEAEETLESAMLTKAERNAAFHARAFAGDDVAIQFSAEKDALAASEDEKESSNHMPGWGSWGGAGLTKSARKAAARARHNPLYKTKLAGTKPQDRKDAKLENVIISEKSDRKGKKYLAPILPHQYERKEEYERSLHMPLGPEWTTKETFQKNTRPRVVVKPGTIIEPISRPLL